MSLMSRALTWIASKLPSPRVIADRAGTSKYLSRWYLYGRPTMPDGSHPFEADGSPKEGIQDPDRRVAVFLHKFHRGDDDAELHNHPWSWSFALVLSGGYREERRQGAPERGGAVSIRVVLPGDINVIRHNTFHRVDLLGTESWSLFVAGTRLPAKEGESWGFWNRATGVYTPWRAFITRKRDPTAFLHADARQDAPRSTLHAKAERVRSGLAAIGVGRYGRPGDERLKALGDRDHCAPGEKLVEVDVFASPVMCTHEDCHICDGYAKEAEAGDPRHHVVLIEADPARVVLS